MPYGNIRAIIQCMKRAAADEAVEDVNSGGQDSSGNDSVAG